MLVGYLACMAPVSLGLWLLGRAVWLFLAAHRLSGAVMPVSTDTAPDAVDLRDALADVVRVEIGDGHTLH
jgi:hypothetical protein